MKPIILLLLISCTSVFADESTVKEYFSNQNSIILRSHEGAYVPNFFKPYNEEIVEVKIVEPRTTWTKKEIVEIIKEEIYKHDHDRSTLFDSGKINVQVSK